MEESTTRLGGRFSLVALIVILVAAVVIVALVRERIINPVHWQVSISGSGRVAYVPDSATITLGVQIDRAPTAESALSQLNTAMNRIVPSLVALGIPQEDIVTQNYSVFPNYDYLEGITRPSGYNANQQVVVKIRGEAATTDQVGTVIETASRNGANQVLGITFEASNLEELKQQATLAAIADARSKAEETAQTAGVRLGKLVGWYEQPVMLPHSPYGPYYGEYGGGGAGPIVPFGSREVIAQVGLTYLVK